VKVRQGRTARTHQPPRVFPGGLFALSRIAIYSGPVAGLAKKATPKTKSNIATIAARKWPSSAAASACSSPAQDIRIVRPRGGWWKARASRGSLMSRWMKSVRHAKRGLVKNTALRRIHRLLGLSEMQVHAGHQPWAFKCPKCHEGEFVRPWQRRPRRTSAHFSTVVSRYPDAIYERTCRLQSRCQFGADFIVEKKSKIGLVRACIKEKARLGEADRLSPRQADKTGEVVAPVGARSLAFTSNFLTYKFRELDRRS